MKNLLEVNFDQNSQTVRKTFQSFYNQIGTETNSKLTKGFLTIGATYCVVKIAVYYINIRKRNEFYNKVTLHDFTTVTVTNTVVPYSYGRKDVWNKYDLHQRQRI